MNDFFWSLLHHLLVVFFKRKNTKLFLSTHSHALQMKKNRSWNNSNITFLSGWLLIPFKCIRMFTLYTFVIKKILILLWFSYRQTTLTTISLLPSKNQNHSILWVEIYNVIDCMKFFCWQWQKKTLCKTQFIYFDFSFRIHLNQNGSSLTLSHYF